MKYELITKALEGIRTIEDVQEKLKLEKDRAIYVLHILRKLGYLKTKYLPNKKRLYYISLRNKQDAISYLEAFNNEMPAASLRISDIEDYFVHGRTIRVEEQLVYALKKGTVRFVISALYLFRKIEDWSYLYQLAKEEHLVRQIAALYEVARMFVRKVRKMPRRFKRLASPKKEDTYAWIIKGISSDNFKNIEKKWKVYIPLNSSDLEEYRRIKK